MIGTGDSGEEVGESDVNHEPLARHRVSPNAGHVAAWSAEEAELSDGGDDGGRT
jgi:hypothetical protein